MSFNILMKTLTVLVLINVHCLVFGKVINFMTDNNERILEFVQNEVDDENATDDDISTTAEGDEIVLRGNAPYQLGSGSCHQTAVWKCGQLLIQAFELSDNQSPQQHFQTNCALRNAFYKCVERRKRQIFCKRKVALSDSFRQKLGSLLWRTRNCITAGCRGPIYYT